jgi:hypothetical protein
MISVKPISQMKNTLKRHHSRYICPKSCRLKRLNRNAFLGPTAIYCHYYYYYYYYCYYLLTAIEFSLGGSSINKNKYT